MTYRTSSSILTAVLVLSVGCQDVPPELVGVSAESSLAPSYSHGESSGFLERFGYGYMKREGTPAQGKRPLLIVQATDPGHPEVHGSTCWDHLATMQKVNDQFRRYSNGAFEWQVEDCREVRLPQNRVPVEGLYPGWGLYPWNAAQRAVKVVEQLGRDGFDFAPYDRDGSGQVTSDELVIFVVINKNTGGGSNRPKAEECVKPVGSSVEVCLHQNVAAVGIPSVVKTITHELAHALGAYDLYYPGGYASWQNQPSKGLTLMGNRGVGLHLDPWHKLALGWSRPRVYPIGGDHAATGDLYLAHLPGEERPIVLYDPSRGYSEYFILQYRAADPDFDPDVPGQGLVVWHMVQRDNHAADFGGTSATGHGEAECQYSYGATWITPSDGNPHCRWISIPATVSAAGYLGVSQVWEPGAESSELRWMEDSAGSPNAGITLRVVSMTDTTLRVRWEPRTVSVPPRPDQDTIYDVCDDPQNWNSPFCAGRD